MADAGVEEGMKCWGSCCVLGSIGWMAGLYPCRQKRRRSAMSACRCRSPRRTAMEAVNRAHPKRRSCSASRNAASVGYPLRWDTAGIRCVGWTTAVDAHICLFCVECHQEVKQRSATNALMRLRRTAAYFRNPSAVRVVTSVFRVVLLDDIRATKDKMLVQPVRAICIQRRWAGSTYETL